MKMRVPILFLLLLTGGVWLWHLSHSRNEPVVPATPDRSEQIETLCKLGHYKHATAAQYADFAATADAEKQTAAAHLFRALSRSEQIHEMNCADAARRLGGHYTPPRKVIVFRGSTTKNLRSAYDGEVRNYDRYRSGSIERATAAGNRYATRTMIRIAGGDMRQTDVLECFIREADTGGYAVCPLCGNLFRTARCDRYCPFCMTSEVQFIRFQ